MGRYLKPAKGVHAPSAILSVVPELRPAYPSSTGRPTLLRMTAVSLAYSVRTRGQWSPAETHTLNNAEDCLRAIEAYARPRRRLFVVSPVASETLTVLGFWPHITKHGARWDQLGIGGPKKPAEPRREDTYYFTSCVLNGKPDILRYTRNGKGLTWVSGIQFFSAPEEELAKCLLYPRVSQPEHYGSPTGNASDAETKALLWLRLFVTLSDWWLAVKGGPFGLTPGQLAMNFFRKRLTPKTVLVHHNQDAKALEERGMFGGRASTWFFGDIDSGQSLPSKAEAEPPRSGKWTIDEPICHVDVRSMYPYLLATREYPVRLLSCRDGRSTHDVRELLEHTSVIANVRLATHIPEYPFRRGDRILYPVGRFNTVLCGDELKLAIDSGCVEQIYLSSVYQKGRPFESMASELIQLRNDARHAGQPAWELFVKSLSNSLGGKLAQKKYDWVRRHDVPCEAPDGWGIWTRLSVGGSQCFRSLAGLVWEKMPSKDKGRPMGAAFAYLAMYGRVMMRHIRDQLPRQTVVSQDTDGLWVVQSAMRHLPLCTTNGPESAGMLRLTRTAHRARFWTPKHYWTEHGWTLSGYSEPEFDPVLASLEHTAPRIPLMGCPNVPASMLLRHRRSSPLDLLPSDCEIGPSGWAEPYLWPQPRKVA